MNTVFPLTANLIVPATGNPNKGFLLFPAAQFGLAYDVLPKPRQETLTIVLTVVEMSTGEVVWPLGTYEITEAGFPHRVNYEEIIAAEAVVSSVTAEWEVLHEVFRAADTALNADPLNEELLEAYTVAYTAVTAKLDEVNAAKAAVPEPDIIWINKYSTVVQMLNGDGTLTEEGVEWAKGIDLGDVTIGDYI
jgi:hypothetical protein